MTSTNRRKSRPQIPKSRLLTLLTSYFLQFSHLVCEDPHCPRAPFKLAPNTCAFRHNLPAKRGQRAKAREFNTYYVCVCVCHPSLPARVFPAFHACLKDASVDQKTWSSEQRFFGCCQRTTARKTPAISTRKCSCQKLANRCPTLGQLLASRILYALLVGEKQNEITKARFCTQSCSKVGQLLVNSSPTPHPMGSCRGLPCSSPLATPKI